MEMQAAEWNKLMEKCMNHVPGGIRIFKKTAAGIVCVEVNEYCAEMLGLSRKQLLGESFEQLEQRIHPEDRERHRLETVVQLNKERKSSGVYRFYNIQKKQYIWFRLDACLAPGPDGSELAYFHYTDVQELKATQAQERSAVQLYLSAVTAAKLLVMEYDLVRNRVTVHDYVSLSQDLPQILEPIPESLKKYIVAKDMPGVEALFLKVKKGEKASCEFWHNDGEGTPISCERLSFEAFEYKDGVPVKAYGISQNITSQKMNELQYQRNTDEFLALNPNFLCTFHLNLTKDICGQGHGSSAYILKNLQAPTASGMLANLSNMIINPERRAEFVTVFNLKNLSECFRQGKLNLEETYFRKSRDEDGQWVTTYVHLLRNQVTGDIEASFYTVDADARVKEEKTVENLVAEEYDCIGLINVAKKQVQYTHVRKQFAASDWALSQAYDQGVLATAVMIDDEIERQKFIRANCLEQILPRLAEGTLEIPYTLGKKGHIRRKLLKYRYLDETRTVVMFTVSDVTAAFLQEQQKEEQLEVALTAAKQASSAKSSFLSRMSHEIRTPMNAIIGMDTLAAQAIGNDEQVSDCISKIGISARYLLSIINDILDMSRIESGKMLLKNEKFLFSDFITEINTMIYNQTLRRGLDYECIVSPQLDESYLGDAMKLQQVLINVLGNAVKFTQHGKVSLEVHPVSQRGSQTKVRFIVNDTGCGIKPEFLEKLFDPFEQEDVSSTTTFGGTGLGLAITKNLVELMGGTITVRSIVGIGSEFTITVPLTVDHSLAMLSLHKYNFDRLSALVVDDDLIICEQAVCLLKEIGMSGDWVTSGREAVEKVNHQFSQSLYYDYILIDWKMPDMDGVETTRQIRRIVGPEVTIIIISAYDWETIASDAKAAGANLLITKPLFKSTLINALQKARGQEEEKIAQERQYDFTGKRILVAEDNTINAEIAKRLLESKHFTVEVAPNGLKALEKFVHSQPGYYDAILMDVRMPLMDGLQATANIRHWDKPDAKTVPIIAMTANAFDEDVEKSRASGMNAHLSKPIEPELLYRTLYHIIYEKP